MGSPEKMGPSQEGNNYKEDSYDDALAYLVQANELQKPFTENWTEGYNKWKKKTE